MKSFLSGSLLYGVVVAAILLVFLCWSMTTKMEETKSRSLSEEEEEKSKKPPLRILYTVTGLAEYNSGQRSTVKGSDRLQETLIPTVTESVTSMLAMGYQVDLFLICGWVMQPDRLQLIRDAIPDSVSIDYWDDAIPWGYHVDKFELGKSKLDHQKRGLARQHRYVIKERLLLYDFFVNFEDVMLVKGSHVETYLKIQSQIMEWRKTAPDEHPKGSQPKKDYHGVMTKGQLQRTLPGFIRVEVLLNEDKYPAQDEIAPVPLDYDYNGQDRQIDPEPCCSVSPTLASNKIPAHPAFDKLMTWEVHILPLGVRKMPQSSFLDWVVLQRGPAWPNKDGIPDYWSGTKGYFKSAQDKRVSSGRRPDARDRKYVNNQGGWMGTQQQIWEWHTKVCMGSFLPPFDQPFFDFDGLDLRDVEYWSGGLQLVTRQNACNMQRIISLDPDVFSRQLLYHTSNNKQKQLSRLRERFTKINHLWAQLNTVRKDAEQSIPQKQP